MTGHDFSRGDVAMGRTLLLLMMSLAVTLLLPIQGSMAQPGGKKAPPRGGMKAKEDEDAKEKADDEAAGPLTRKLTQSEIFRIRFMELRGSRLGKDTAPESITVKLDNKLVDEFLKMMEGDPLYAGEQARAEFRKLTSAQKIHLMAAEKGTQFADRIHITSDPEIFVEFRKKVMPTILKGCSTVGCHGMGGGEEAKFHLFKDPKKSAETTYANFIILNDVQYEGNPLINRSQPANSLLLTYMLPTKDVKPEQRHPGKTEIKPLFQNRAMAEFKRVESWITSLKHPADDYGVHLLERPTTSGPQPFSDPPKP